MSELVERKLEQISRDQEHGAAFLAREALQVMVLAADESRAVEAQAFVKEVARLGCRLISLRPSMSSPIANAVVRAFDAISRKPEKTTTVNSLRQATHRIIEDLLAVSHENVKRAAEQACQLVPERLPGQGARVLTHSYSETCLLALRARASRKIFVSMWPNRGPFARGRRPLPRSATPVLTRPY